MMLERARRQVYSLTAEDLAEHPVWEFCSDEEDSDGQDEATVRPIELEWVPNSPGQYVVGAAVHFADGTTAKGYLYSGAANDYGCIQPVVVLDSAQVNFWLGSLRFLDDPRGTVAKAYTRLGKNASEAFPVTFKSLVGGDGVPGEFSLDGFQAKGIDGQVTLLR